MEIFIHTVYFVYIFLVFYINGLPMSPLSNIIDSGDTALHPFNIERLSFNSNGNKNVDVQSKSDIKKTNDSQHWVFGVVQYYVDVSSYDYLIAYRIRTAMNVLEASTCVKFSPLLLKPQGEEHYLHITNPNRIRECDHKPWFKDTGEVMLVLGYDCIKNVDILHALLHALGLNDAVTHPHRDKYIRVIWNNIQPVYRHLYNIQEDVTNVEYDPMSVMHFYDRDYTLNGHATIETVVSGLIINPLETLSQLDKLRLRILFNNVCNDREINNLYKACHHSLNDKGKKDDLDLDGHNLDELKKNLIEPRNNLSKSSNEEVDIENQTINQGEGNDSDNKVESEEEKVNQSENDNKINENDSKINENDEQLNENDKQINENDEQINENDKKNENLQSTNKEGKTEENIADSKNEENDNESAKNDQESKEKNNKESEGGSSQNNENNEELQDENVNKSERNTKESLED